MSASSLDANMSPSKSRRCNLETILSPCNFLVTDHESSKDPELLVKLQLQLGKLDFSSLLLQSEHGISRNIRKDKYVALKHPTFGLSCRGKVHNIFFKDGVQICKVFLIDFGQFINIKSTSLIPLTFSYIEEFEPLSFNVQLYGIVPSTKKLQNGEIVEVLTDDFAPEALKRVEELSQGNYEVYVCKKMIEDRTVYGDLYFKKNDCYLSLSEDLQEKNYAVYSEEVFLDKINQRRSSASPSPNDSDILFDIEDKSSVSTIVNEKVCKQEEKQSGRNGVLGYESPTIENSDTESTRAKSPIKVTPKRSGKEYRRHLLEMLKACEDKQTEKKSDKCISNENFDRESPAQIPSQATGASIKRGDKTHIESNSNVTLERYKFFKTEQKENQIFNDFLEDLLIKSKNCEFGEQRDCLVRDRIIIGIRCDEIREILLKTENLDFDKAVAICKEAEGREKSSVAKKSPMKWENTKEKFSDNRPLHFDKCKYCGTSHEIRKCPAFFNICEKCDRKGHYPEFCPPMKTENKGQSSFSREKGRKNSIEGDNRRKVKPERTEMEFEVGETVSYKTVDKEWIKCTIVSKENDNFCIIRTEKGDRMRKRSCFFKKTRSDDVGMKKEEDSSWN